MEMQIAGDAQARGGTNESATMGRGAEYGYCAGQNGAGKPLVLV